MKAAVVQGPGQAPVYADFAAPTPVEGEQRIQVAAAALSQLARARAAGKHYSSEGQFPFVPGVDGVGKLEDGSRVYFLLPRAPYGGFGGQTVVPAAHCAPVPDDLDDVTAAAIANPGMSSWAALVERAHLEPGETVLINGATGASGQLAVQIAKLLGAKKVIATGRNPAVLASLAALGADETIPLNADDQALEDSFKPHFAKGVDVVLDYLWGRSAERLLTAAAKAAERPLRYVEIGAASGGEISLPGAVLRSRAIVIMGSGIGSVSLNRLVDCIRELFVAAKAGGFRLPTQTYPLSELAGHWRDGGARVVFTP